MTMQLANPLKLDSGELTWGSLIPWVQQEGFEIFFQDRKAGYGPQVEELYLVAAHREKKLLLNARPHGLTEHLSVGIHGCVKLRSGRTAESIQHLSVHMLPVPNATDQRYLFSYFTEQPSLGTVDFLALLGEFVNWSYPDAPLDLRNAKQREADTTTPVMLASLRAVNAPNWVYNFIAH